MSNNVVEIYKGVKIRRTNVVVLKWGISQYKKIIDEVDKTGLSIPKIIAYSGMPCDRCKNLGVTVYDKNDLQLTIKRGIISVPEGNGSNVIEQAKSKNGQVDKHCKKNK